MKQVTSALNHLFIHAVHNIWILTITGLLWYGILVYALDFDGLNTIRTQLLKLPYVTHADHIFRAANNTIYRLHLRPSQLLNIFFLPYIFFSDDLPRYDLVIDADDIRKLEANAAAVLASDTQFITDEFNLSVPATLMYAGKTYKAKVKYRGDISTHWMEHKKSWKLEFEDPKYFNHHHVLNLIIPEERSFIFNALSKHVAQKLSLPTLPYEYVFVSLNGQDLGLYYTLSQFSADFLETYERPEGNFYSDRFGDVNWSKRIDLFNSMADLKKYASHPVRPEQDYSDIHLLQQAIYKKDTALLEYILNIEQFLRWQAHSVLMNSTQQDSRHNFKLYANPTTGLLEFIPNDVNFSSEVGQLEHKCQSPDIRYNPYVDALLSNPEYLLKRNQLLWEYVSDTETVADDISHMRKLYEKLRHSFYKGLHISSIIQFEYTYQGAALEKHYAFLRQLLETPQPHVLVKRHENELEITATGTSLPGFQLEQIKLVPANGAQKVIQRSQTFLPSYSEEKTALCKYFSEWTFTEKLPCPQCQNTAVELSFKNLTNGARVTPSTTYVD